MSPSRHIMHHTLIVHQGYCASIEATSEVRICTFTQNVSVHNGTFSPTASLIPPHSPKHYVRNHCFNFCFTSSHYPFLVQRQLYKPPRDRLFHLRAPEPPSCQALSRLLPSAWPATPFS